MNLEEQMQSFIEYDQEDNAGQAIPNGDGVEMEAEYAPTNTADIVKGLLSLDNPAESSIDQIVNASFAEAPQETLDPSTTRDQAISLLNELRGQAAKSQFLVDDASPSTAESIAMIEQDFKNGLFDKSNTTIGVDKEGTRSITMSGKDGVDPGFQSLGKYTSPEEFMRINPEGFKATNPTLYARMQAEAQARAEAPSKYAMQIGNELNAKMDLITKETNPMKKEMMLSELRSSIAIAGANMTKNMRTMAEDAAGINKIQQLYDQSARADMMTGNGLISPRTKQFQMQLNEAKKNVGNLTKQMISENPTLAALGSKLKGFMATQERLVAADWKNEEKQKEKVAEIADRLTPENVKAISMIFPEIKENTLEAATKIKAIFASGDKKTKEEWNMILSTDDPVNLLPHAVAGSTLARKLVVRNQMERTGLSEADVQKDIAKFSSIVNNPADFEKVLKSLPLTPENKRLKNKYALLSTETNKESAKERHDIRMSLAANFMKTFKQDEIISDVGSWPTLAAYPEMASTVDKLKTLDPKGRVSIDALVAGYVNKAPKELRAARVDEIKKVAGLTAAPYKNSIFGSVDSVRVNSIIDSKIATSSLIGDFIENANLGSLIPGNIMGGFAPPTR